MESNDDKFNASFDALSREELLSLLKKVLKENLRLTKLQEEKVPEDTGSTAETKQMEFGSYGSSNVMFLKAADNR